MNAVDEIQAAIDKLTLLKFESTPGPWAHDGLGHVETVPEFDLHRFDIMAETILRADLHDSDAEITATLHATIDAQLAILRAASVDEDEAREHWASVGKPHLRGPAKIVPINMAALTLARAINGTA